MALILTVAPSGVGGGGVYASGAAGGWSKLSNVEEDTRVPLVVAGPAEVVPAHRRGAVTSALVELVDLFPTVRDRFFVTANGEAISFSVRNCFSGLWPNPFRKKTCLSRRVL